MKNLMIPAMPAVEPGRRPEVRAIGRGEKGSSFSEYLEKKMVKEPGERKNLLGAGRGKVAKLAARAAAKEAQAPAEKGGDAQPAASLHALLGQFLAELRGQAKSEDAGPGVWTFTLPDASLLTKLAADAGMSDVESAALVQQFEANQGTMELDSLLAMLVANFQAGQNEKPVTVPETELPFLDLILERMGVPAETVQALGEKAVTGDNQLDLTKFLAALGNVQADRPVTLTTLEAEQLQNLFDEAGLPKLMQRALLPERHTTWENPNQPLQPVTMTLDRLRTMLSDGLQSIADSGRKADIPQFLNDLKAIFAEAGFAEKTVGWSPAVQKAMEETYRSLLDNVDLASVTVQKVPVADQAARTKETKLFGDEATDGVRPEPVIAAADGDVAAPVVATGRADLPADGDAAMLRREEGAPAAPHHDETTPASAESARLAQQAAPPEVKTARHLPRLTPAQEQQTVERLSTGVVRGLRANEHHLVLRLYPKELGEVKVEMMVRDNQVALSFAMENSRVKEVLEKNMDMFQQNLEQQGFTLEECQVSVNQQHDDNAQAWREFVQGWQERRGEGQKMSLADVASDVLYLRPAALAGQETGIDFFA